MSTHEAFRPYHHSPGPSDRSFGLVAAAALALAGLSPLLRHNAVRWWALAPAAAFMCLALTRPNILGPLNSAWMKLGLLMNRILSPILSGILFFAVITPVSYLLRMRGRDALRLYVDPEVRTYWLERPERGPKPESMADQF